MYFSPRCLTSSSTHPSSPRPSLISVCSHLETTSRDANSLNSGAYLSMNLSLSEFSRYAPSPRAASLIKTPLPFSVVGWYCTISISINEAPTLYPRLIPSPVHINAFVLGSNTLPKPPAARITALARTTSILPLRISIITAPPHLPSLTIKDSTNHSSYTKAPAFKICSYKTCKRAWPVKSATKKVLASRCPPKALVPSFPSSSLLNMAPMCSIAMTSLPAS